MAFPEQTPRTFTRANIEAITPEQIDCYGLFKSGQWIYVGRGDIRTRLLAHLNGDNACITAAVPTQWVDEVTNQDQAREKALITYSPNSAPSHDLQQETTSVVTAAVPTQWVDEVTNQDQARDLALFIFPQPDLQQESPSRIPSPFWTSLPFFGPADA